MTPLASQFCVLLFALAASLAAAADRLVAIDTRPSVRVAYWLMEREGAKATLLLLPGGGGKCPAPMWLAQV